MPERSAAMPEDDLQVRPGLERGFDLAGEASNDARPGPLDLGLVGDE
jgi:hypothetical protein